MKGPWHPLDINEVVDRALLLIGDQMRKIGISVEASLDRALPEIAADAIAIERVLINLLATGRTGLGLWLSRRIIQEHSGKIDVQSELGKETTFTIRLPTGDFSRR